MLSKTMVEEARRATKEFGARCPKFVGAVTVEILREALRTEGLQTSRRDVFVRGIPIEIDLIIPRTASSPPWGLVYEAGQVAVAMEVKHSGSYGKGGLSKLKENSRSLSGIGVAFVYVSFEDTQSYKWRPKPENLDGIPCFTLAWHKKTGGDFAPTGDWEKLLRFLKGGWHSTP